MTNTPLDIVITGATSGIGKAVALALAADGHRLYVCARRQDQLEEMAKTAPLAMVRTCDVGNEEDVKAFLAEVAERTQGIDVLINAAGSFGEIGLVGEMDTAAWWQTIQVNLFGTVTFCHHALPLLRAGRGKRIINFAGGGAFSPLPRYSAYAVSKSAVVRFTESLAEEIKSEGLVANCMAPGFVITEIHDATLKAGPQRAGDPMFSHTQKKLQHGSVPMATVVECARYLLTDRAAGLTGKTISVSFDPWDSDAFNAHIETINQSDIYTGRRINPANLEDHDLRDVLLAAAQATKSKRALVP